MAPALTASTAMLARRQLTRAAVATTPSSSTAAMLVAFRAAAQLQRGYATPNGPPPQNFRQSKRIEWSWDRESTLDRVGKFFLMTEMARGMYLLLEQFFRPPYVFISRCFRNAVSSPPVADERTH